MSYNCDECGQNPVEQYGSWCSECQKREFYLQQEDEEKWYSSSALCQRCNFAWGGDPNDKCSEYDMPLYMVKRKRKCKCFKEIDYSIIN